MIETLHANKMPCFKCYYEPICNYQTTCTWGLKSIDLVPMYELKMPASIGTWFQLEVSSWGYERSDGQRRHHLTKRPIYLDVCYVL
jgi:hypothetical protein